MLPKLGSGRLVQHYYRVLCRWVLINKIQDLWMPTPFKVTALPDDSKAVYTVAPGDGSCPPKNVHRAELNENNFTASSQQ